MVKYDVCVVGTGAGGAPLAWSLAKRGLSVLILEKGSDFNTTGVLKDELSLCVESPFIPKGTLGTREVRYNGVEIVDRHLWMGCTVGGGTRIMSGYFLPMNKSDFTPRSSFGTPLGATHQDWPIGFKELQPYYDSIASFVGISTYDKSFPALKRHKAGDFLAKSCTRLGVQTAETPRAILSADKGDRGSCSYSGLCGSYPCTTGAKGSTRDTYIKEALRLPNVTMKTGRDVVKVIKNGEALSRIEAVGPLGLEHYEAKTYVLALSAIETARLLLNSRVGNSSGQVGKNLTFTVPCEVTASFRKGTFPAPTFGESPFVLTYTDQFRQLPYPQLSYKHGGSVLFMFPHANPINRAKSLSFTEQGKRIIGPELQKRVTQWYEQVHLTTDTFIDYLPWKGSGISLSKRKDHFGRALARVDYSLHQASLDAKNAVAFNLQELFKTMGPQSVQINPNPFTAGEQQHGTCRFGDSAKHFVLDPNCRSYDLKNCYITDGSFFPSGISVPSTFTIMANSLRVADEIYKNF